MSSLISPILASVTVEAPVARAFALFVQRLGEWWPPEYTWSGRALVAIGIQPVVGGACYEVGPHGFRCDWGRVLELDRPNRVAFSWQIAPSRVPEPDPARASEVRVSFAEDSAGRTSVSLEHKYLERHGEGGEAYREGMASPMGWPLILERFAAAAARAAALGAARAVADGAPGLVPAAGGVADGAPAGWRIEWLDGSDPAVRAAAAELMVSGFREHWPLAWPTLADAEREVAEALAPERIALAAWDPTGGTLLGWIGAQPLYDGHVWELHPLVVRAEQQGGGLGRALVHALEAEVARRGGLTLWVGTDDEAGLTSLGGVDLYPDLLHHVLSIRNRGGHPYSFYQKLGFQLAGVVPDANGFGRPDLLLAKRITRRAGA